MALPQAWAPPPSVLLSMANTWTATQTFSPAANTNAIAVTGFSLTGSDAHALIDLAGSWNTTGTPSAINLNVTDTASNAASLFFNGQIASVPMVQIDKAGRYFTYNLWTSSGANYERGVVAWNSGAFEIGTESVGTGATRTIRIKATNTIRLASGGSDMFTIDFGQKSLLPFTDAAYDIGTASARIRDGRFSRDIYFAGGTQAMLRAASAVTSGAGAATGTLTNAPTAGNPTKWIPFNDAGTTRYIPAW